MSVYRKNPMNIIWGVQTCEGCTVSAIGAGVNIVFTLPVSENPSCLQTILASVVPKKSSQTVPHTLALQTSTRPSRLEGPSTSRTLACGQPVSWISYAG
jgi:hypothetical protein